MAENDSNTKDAAVDSFDPGEIKTEIGFFKTLFHLHDVGRESVIPAIVTAYNPALHAASVKPLVEYVKRTETGLATVLRPVYEDVPVYQQGSGGYRVNMPLYVGDTGFLLAVDREWETAKSSNSAELLAPMVWDKENKRIVVWDETKKEYVEGPNKGAVRPDSFALGSFDFGVFVPWSWSGGGFGDGKYSITKVTEGGKFNKRIVLDGDGMSVENTETVVTQRGEETTTKRMRYGVSGLDVEGHAVFHDGETVYKDSEIHDKLTVSNGLRKVFVTPADLKASDAMFREETVITGVKKKNTTVSLKTRKVLVLADEGESADPFSFEVGESEGGITGVQFIGTDSTVSSKSDVFTFASGANSNVSVHMSGSVMTIGVYYV